MKIYDVVLTVQPGALTSDPVGRTTISTHDDPDKARKEAELCNDCRSAHGKGCPGVSFAVEEHDEESPNRAPTRHCRRDSELPNYTGMVVGGIPVVRRGNVILTKHASLRVENKSPDGFQWGYEGSGPAQLALALILDATGSAEVARRHYQEFKRCFVATWSQTAEWHVTGGDIRRWIAAREAQAAQ